MNDENYKQLCAVQIVCEMEDKGRSTVIHLTLPARDNVFSLVQRWGEVAVF